MRFADRSDAGKQLAKRLSAFSDKSDVLLYALPRGGVVVAAEIANTLHLPFDVLVTRKISAPQNEEYAIGAIAETGETVWDEAERSTTDPTVLRQIIKREQQEAKRRIKTYRQGRPLPSFEGKTVILIDDGVATGLTMRAAVAVAKHQHAKKILIAVPHGAKESISLLRQEVDDIVVLDTPILYASVGQYYDTFPQTSDAEVHDLLTRYGNA